MNNGNSEWLVETNWLEANLENPDISIIDATWYMPGTPENPQQQFLASHIPGALFFDIDEIAYKQTDLPHMLPDATAFAFHMSQMGIANTHHIVVYDRLGIFSAPRVWWTFRAMGHNRVSVLNGGLKKWLAENRTTHTGPSAQKTQTAYRAAPNFDLVRNFDQILDNVKNSSQTVILDARPAGRFNGEVEEPRPGLKKGHIPGSKNLQFNELISATGEMQSPEKLKEIFNTKDIDQNTQVITTCGSGITAAILSFALTLIGNKQTSVYDGSWAEWGAREEAVISTSGETA